MFPTRFFPRQASTAIGATLLLVLCILLVASGRSESRFGIAARFAALLRKRSHVFSLGAGILLLVWIFHAEDRHRREQFNPELLAQASISVGSVFSSGATRGTAVLTYHNDNARTGLNPTETTLTPANVNAGSFGKLHSYPVDGYVYAQPLYIPQVAVPGSGSHNLVLVANQHDSVYAFDPDSASSEPLWRMNFTNPDAGINPVSSADVGADDIVPEIGITSTPVVDLDSNTIYVVAATKENGAFYHRLHALDLATGAEKFAGPQVISASFAGNASDSSGGVVNFQSRYQLQRAALLLSQGRVYVAFGSNADSGSYHGWVLAFEAATLQQVGAWLTTPNGYQGGIWMSGCGPAADDAGSLYVSTANGVFDVDVMPGRDYGDSIVRLLNGPRGLAVADFFTPYDQALMAKDDLDLGSAGIVVLPDQPGAFPHLLLTSGKNGHIYLLNRDALGGYNPNASRNVGIVQEMSGLLKQQMGTAAYWDGNVYFGAGVSASRDSIRAFSLRNGRLSIEPTSRTQAVYKLTRSTVSVSANGNDSGIVWAVETDGYYAKGRPGQAVLHAYDARDLGRELYNSRQRPRRDSPGPASKFTVPTVVNGKVFIGTANQLSVYGLLSPR